MEEHSTQHGGTGVDGYRLQMKHTITITFESDAPQARVEEVAERAMVQLEDLSDPDYSLVENGIGQHSDSEEIEPYDYTNVVTTVNGETI